MESKKTQDTIAFLNKEIIEITQNNDTLKTESQEAQNSLRLLQTRLDDLQSLNQGMISSIRTLETDNKTYSNELQQLSEIIKLPTSTIDAYKPPVHPSTSFVAMKPTSRINSQILIEGDPNVRGLSRMIKADIGRPIDINCQWSEHLGFEQGVKLCQALSKNFTHKDHIILLWESENAIRGHTIKQDSLRLI